MLVCDAGVWQEEHKAGVEQHRRFAVAVATAESSSRNVVCLC